MADERLACIYMADERLACIYVVKEHLGFYTAPEIISVPKGKDLHSVVNEVLSSKWHWSNDERKNMLEAGAIKSFFINPIFIRVWKEFVNFTKEQGIRIFDIEPLKACELQIRLCKVLKIESPE